MGRRINYLDYIRTFAIGLVVLCHSVEFVFSGEYYVEVSNAVLIGCTILHDFARIGVPLFLMLSGYLLLDKEYNSEKDVFKFWKTKLLPLFITWVIWIVIFYFFKCWCDEIPFSTKNLLFSVVMRERTLFHDWYMYMLIGMYCVYPFVSILLKKFSVKMYAVILGFIYLFCMLVPTVITVIGKDITAFYLVYANIINYSSFYIIYIVLGYCLKKFDKLNFKLPINLVGFIVTMVITVVYSLYRRKLGQSCYIWYDFAILPFTAIFLFNLIRNVKTPSLFEKVFARFSACSFGIYLIHVPVQLLLSKLIDFSMFSSPVSIAIKFICGFFISYVIVEIIGRIKYLKTILFLMK